uniref:Uncharacterized protein n=1 Tax=Timema genevievae TaxID=629358 RepID=A0A7R9K7N7_TIMGE|nr:unnamed protein product [Timema genevievae]
MKNTSTKLEKLSPVMAVTSNSRIPLRTISSAGKRLMWKLTSESSMDLFT